MEAKSVNTAAGFMTGKNNMSLLHSKKINLENKIEKLSTNVPRHRRSGKHSSNVDNEMQNSSTELETNRGTKRPSQDSMNSKHDEKFLRQTENETDRSLIENSPKTRRSQNCKELFVEIYSYFDSMGSGRLSKNEKEKSYSLTGDSSGCGSMKKMPLTDTDAKNTRARWKEMSAEGYYRCGCNGGQCSFTSLFRNELEFHVGHAHPSDSEYTCVHCTSPLATGDSFLWHLDQHLWCQNLKLTCQEPGCPYHSYRPSTVINHMRIAHEYLHALHCWQCKKLFNSLYKFTKHIRCNLLPVAQCAHCQAIDTNIRRLLDHMKQEHASKAQVLGFQNVMLCGKRIHRSENSITVSLGQQQPASGQANYGSGVEPHQASGESTRPAPGLESLQRSQMETLHDSWMEPPRNSSMEPLRDKRIEHQAVMGHNDSEAEVFHSFRMADSTSLCRESKNGSSMEQGSWMKPHRASGLQPSEASGLKSLLTSGCEPAQASRFEMEQSHGNIPQQRPRAEFSQESDDQYLQRSECGVLERVRGLHISEGVELRGWGTGDGQASLVDKARQWECTAEQPMHTERSRQVTRQAGEEESSFAKQDRVTTQKLSEYQSGATNIASSSDHSSDHFPSTTSERSATAKGNKYTNIESKQENDSGEGWSTSLHIARRKLLMYLRKSVDVRNVVELDAMDAATKLDMEPMDYEISLNGSFCSYWEDPDYVPKSDQESMAVDNLEDEASLQMRRRREKLKGDVSSKAKLRRMKENTSPTRINTLSPGPGNTLEEKMTMSSKVKKYFTCKFCSFATHLPLSIYKHLYTEHKAIITCPTCRQTCKSRTGFLNHLNICDPLKAKEIYAERRASKWISVTTLTKKADQKQEKQETGANDSITEMLQNGSYDVKDYFVQSGSGGDSLLQCVICTFSFKRYRGDNAGVYRRMHKHMLLMHVPRLFLCMDCNFTDHRKEVVKRHIRGIHLDFKAEPQLMLLPKPSLNRHQLPKEPKNSPSLESAEAETSPQPAPLDSDMAFEAQPESQANWLTSHSQSVFPRRPGDAFLTGCTQSEPELDTHTNAPQEVPDQSDTPTNVSQRDPRQSDIPTKVHKRVTYRNDIPTKVHKRVTDRKDITTKVHKRVTYRNDISTKVHKRVTYQNDIPTKVPQKIPEVPNQSGTSPHEPRSDQIASPAKELQEVPGQTERVLKKQSPRDFYTVEKTSRKEIFRCKHCSFKTSGRLRRCQSSRLSIIWHVRYKHMHRMEMWTGAKQDIKSRNRRKEKKRMKVIQSGTELKIVISLKPVPKAKKSTAKRSRAHRSSHDDNHGSDRDMETEPGSLDGMQTVSKTAKDFYKKRNLSGTSVAYQCLCCDYKLCVKMYHSHSARATMIWHVRSMHMGNAKQRAQSTSNSNSKSRDEESLLYHTPSQFKAQKIKKRPPEEEGKKKRRKSSDQKLKHRRLQEHHPSQPTTSSQDGQYGSGKEYQPSSDKELEPRFDMKLHPGSDKELHPGSGQELQLGSDKDRESHPGSGNQKPKPAENLSPQNSYRSGPQPAWSAEDLEEETQAPRDFYRVEKYGDRITFLCVCCDFTRSGTLSCSNGARSGIIWHVRSTHMTCRRKWACSLCDLRSHSLKWLEGHCRQRHGGLGRVVSTQATMGEFPPRPPTLS